MGRAEIQAEINEINQSISSLTTEIDKFVEIKIFNIISDND